VVLGGRAERQGGEAEMEKRHGEAAVALRQGEG
jgi:hypothetical protein